MKYEARKKEIIRMLKVEGMLEVSHTASQLSVSDITIRRDLDQLAQEKLLRRTHGGAVALDNEPLIHFKLKADQNIAAKRIIGQKAAELVKEGDTIFMDCGSTTFQMCQHITNLNIKVITNSLPVAAALQSSIVKVNLIGGEIDPARQAIHGKMAEWHIAQYHADKAFIGVDAIDSEGNLWAHSESEAGNSLAMIGQSDEVFVLADESKVGKRSVLKFWESSIGYHLVSE